MADRVRSRDSYRSFTSSWHSSVTRRRASESAGASVTSAEMIKPCRDWIDTVCRAKHDQLALVVSSSCSYAPGLTSEPKESEPEMSCENSGVWPYCHSHD